MSFSPKKWQMPHRWTIYYSQYFWIYKEWSHYLLIYLLFTMMLLCFGIFIHLFISLQCTTVMLLAKQQEKSETRAPWWRAGCSSWRQFSTLKETAPSPHTARLPFHGSPVIDNTICPLGFVLITWTRGLWVEWTKQETTCADKTTTYL